MIDVWAGFEALGELWLKDAPATFPVDILLILEEQEPRAT